MPRRLRIQFPGAIDHVMSRGNVRQDIVDDDHDRQQFLERLAAQAVRSRWEVISFVLMTNHFHLLVRTPIANLAAGMQRFLSAHAKGIAARHQRPGHLFQGRYKAELIEDESYYWTVSRYIHLNPVRAHLVAGPEDWPWSSFPGYLLPARRLSWVGNERLWGGQGSGGARGQTGSQGSDGGARGQTGGARGQTGGARGQTWGARGQTWFAVSSVAISGEPGVRRGLRFPRLQFLIEVASIERGSQRGSQGSDVVYGFLGCNF